MRSIRPRRWWLAAALTALPLTAIAQSGPVPAPKLGAASNFAQVWRPRMLESALSLPVTDFRDALYWRAIEQPGGDDFSDPRRRYPDLLAEQGAGMSLTVNNGHPAHDDGNTPLSPEAVAGFADFAARMVTRFPAINAVEVGNEMNSDRFVSGPGWDGDLGTRAISYVALLAATADAVRAARPDVRILGGAAHSIPLAWFVALFRAGAARYMDALVIHPYTVAPEQLRRQIDLLRSLPEAREMPIEVTEFGLSDPRKAPAHLLKNYCQMALAGVTRVVWYPLNPRGDGLTPLIDRRGMPTDVGRSYRFIGAELAGREVTDAAPDPFTHGCFFGADRLVIWGAPRILTLSDSGVKAFDASGEPLPRDTLSLSRDRPIVLLSDGPDLRLGEGWQLAPQRVVADSVDQFAYPGGDGEDPFTRLLRGARGDYPLQTRPGQQKGGVPWVPYLGTSRDGVLRAGADWVLPSHPDAGPLRVVYRYEVPRTGRFDLSVTAAPSERSTDGITLDITLNGRALTARTLTAPETLRRNALEMRAGDVLEIAIGPGETARGDVTRLRVTLAWADPP